jgi:hypothetical protein
MHYIEVNFMVFLVDWDKVHKFSTTMLILGILCVAVAGPVLSYGLSTWPVVPQGTQTIKDTSMSNVTAAYAYRFTITNDEQISAKVSCTYDNCSVIVKIFTNSAFDSAFNTGTPSWDPDLLTGLTFMRSQPAIGVTPTYVSDASYTTLSEGVYAFIDFGGGSGAIAPGVYVIVVYGDNSGVGTDVKFDLQITQEIFGRIWGRIVSEVGWILIIVFGILSVTFAIKKTMEGRA